MKAELTSSQIGELYAFVARKNVKFYDLQIELVDHLASKIEQKWIEKPTLSFEEALANVYAEFGIFGFDEFVQRAHFAVRAKHQKIWWRYFKQFWQPPQIIATFLLWGMVRMCFEKFDYQTVMWANLVTFLTHAIVSMYLLFRMLHKQILRLTLMPYLRDYPFEGVILIFLFMLTNTNSTSIPVGLMSGMIAINWLMIRAAYQADADLLNEQRSLYPQVFT
jgi:hypothetical protein